MMCQVAKLSLFMMSRQGLAFKVQGHNDSLSMLGEGSLVETRQHLPGCKIQSILYQKGLVAGQLNNWCRDRVQGDASYELNAGQYCTKYASNPNVKFTCMNKGANSFRGEFSEETGCWYPDASGCLGETRQYNSGCKIESILYEQGLVAGQLNNWCRDRVQGDASYELNAGQYCTKYASNPNVKFTCMNKGDYSFRGEFSEEPGCWYPEASGCLVSLGNGYCRVMASGQLQKHQDWTTYKECIDLASCQNECHAGCAGIAWTATPAADANYDECYGQGRPRCVVYMGTVPAETYATNMAPSQDYTCYRGPGGAADTIG
jgi:hypothetical protein